jgi:hypothetical protein
MDAAVRVDPGMWCQDVEGQSGKPKASFLYAEIWVEDPESYVSGASV